LQIRAIGSIEGENSGAWKYVANNYLVYFTKKSGGHGHIATGFPGLLYNDVIHAGGTPSIGLWEASDRSAHVYLGYILK